MSPTGSLGSKMGEGERRQVCSYFAGDEEHCHRKELTMACQEKLLVSFGDQ